MKHWTIKAIEQLLLQRFDLAVREKRPFPGQFPTRVFARINDFTYLGKPSYRAYMQMRNAFQKGYFEYSVVEFDRGGLIYLNSRENQRARQIIRMNDQLWAAYHPHQNPDYLLSWMGYNFRLGKAGWYVVGGQKEEAA